MQPHTVAPQGRASPSEAQNKARLGKLQSPRSIIPTENKEFINQQDLHPVPLNKSSDDQDLNLGFTQGNSQYDDQVDCLSRQVELMDINLKTQT